jgi:hypothetical protein
VVPAAAGAVRPVALGALYNSVEPTWLGVPFFYWFQLVLVLICAAVTAFVYFVTESSQQQ